MIQFVVINDI